MTSTQNPSTTSPTEFNVVVPKSVDAAKAENTATSQRAEQTSRRVLHVINGEHFSGAERVQDLLALGLPEFRYEAGFACVKPVKFPDKRASQDAVLYDLAMKSKLDLRAAGRLSKIAKHGGFDLMHAHSPRSLMITSLASKFTGIPFVYHVHSPTSKDSSRMIANRVNTFIEKFSLRNCAQLICVSESLGDHMRAEGFDDDLITVVPNGVPCHGELLPRSAPTNSWTLGMVALYRPRKGTEVLLQALSLLRGEGCDVRLNAVGPFETDDYDNTIRSLARELGVEDAITWTGFTSDVNAELHKMDIMVLPSLFGEGLPMVIIEAMAAGVPVVSTRVQGVPEVLQEGTGLVAEPNSPEDLAANIRKFISGEVNWSDVREKAWRRQAERFSDVSMSQGVAEAYDRVLDQ